MQIASVLKKVDRNTPPMWDIFGEPVRNVLLVDNMRESNGEEWHQGFWLNDIDHLFTKVLVEPCKPARERRRRE